MSGASPRRARSGLIAAVACTLVVPGALGAAPAAFAQEPGTENVPVRSVRGLWTHFSCWTPDCARAGQIDVMVDKSIRKRLKLRTTKIATGSIKQYGEGIAAVPKGSAATGKRLKASALAARGIGKGSLKWGMESVPVKVVFKLSAPFARTVTVPGTLEVNFSQVWTGSSIDFDGGAYLCIPAQGDVRFEAPRTCGTGEGAGEAPRGRG